MAVCIVILFILSFYHLVYEGIIVPLERRNIRYKLFRLRDELRRIKINRKNDFDDELFDYMDNSINNSIKLIPIVNLFFFAKVVKDFITTPEMVKRVERKNIVISSHSISELKNIDERMTQCVKESLIVNTGGWLIYIVPPLLLLIICLSLFVHLKKKVITSIKLQLARLPHTPESEIKRLLPEYAYTNTYYNNDGYAC